jgi:hypothetical protein
MAQLMDQDIEHPGRVGQDGGDQDLIVLIGRGGRGMALTDPT